MSVRVRLGAIVRAIELVCAGVALSGAAACLPPAETSHVARIERPCTAEELGPDGEGDALPREDRREALLLPVPLGNPLTVGRCREVRAAPATARR